MEALTRFTIVELIFFLMVSYLLKNVLCTFHNLEGDNGYKSGYIILSLIFVRY